MDGLVRRNQRSRILPTDSEDVLHYIFMLERYWASPGCLRKAKAEATLPLYYDGQQLWQQVQEPEKSEKQSLRMPTTQLRVCLGGQEKIKCGACFTAGNTGNIDWRERGSLPLWVWQLTEPDGVDWEFELVGWCDCVFGDWSWEARKGGIHR